MPSISDAHLVQGFTGNTGGTLLGAVGPSIASANNVAAIQGILHSINISSDSSQNTVIVWDGLHNGAPYTKIAQILTSGIAGQATSHVFDCQLQSGLYVLITGAGTNCGVTFTYS